MKKKPQAVPGYERVHLNLPTDLLDLLRRVAEKDKRTLSATVELRLKAELLATGEGVAFVADPARAE